MKALQKAAGAAAAHDIVSGTSLDVPALLALAGLLGRHRARAAAAAAAWLVLHARLGVGLTHVETQAAVRTNIVTCTSLCFPHNWNANSDTKRGVGKQANR
jgi:hypothetical protein